MFLNGRVRIGTDPADATSFAQFGPAAGGTVNFGTQFENVGQVILLGPVPCCTINFWDDITLTAPSTANVAPIANAGPDQNSVSEGDLVTLDSSGSTDPDDDPLTRQWSQIAGLPVDLNDYTAVMPTFTAPFVAGNTTLTFEVEVDDGALTDTDTVDIGIVNNNNPPVADAGDDFTIKEGAIAELDGTGSYDPENDTITEYTWTQVDPDGPFVTLNTTNPAQPTFTAPTGAVGETLLFRLQVSDGKEASTPTADTDPATASDAADTVKGTIVMNSPPVANAGADQTVDEGSPVSLNALGSSDPDGDGISFSWSQTGGPEPISLSDPTSATPSFDAPPVSALTPFEFEVTVTDDDPFSPKSDTDTVVINVRNANDPPSCELAFAKPASVWPPNHKMEDVSIDGVMDKDSIYNMITLQVTGVTQDEPVNGMGDGDSSPDAAIVMGDPADSVRLRRERAGGGNGRVYKVSFNATDGFEDCDGAVYVNVNHDRKRDAIDDGQTVDSTQP